MASRTGFTATALAVYNDTDHSQMPKGALAYATGGSGSTVTSAGLDLVSQSVTLPPNRMLKISVRGQISNGGTSAGGTVNVYEGASDLGRVHRHEDAAGESFAAGFVIVDGPSGGSHTYKIRGDTTSGTFDSFGNFAILVEDIGPETAAW